MWGDSPGRDGRGKLIESILQDNDLILLNSKYPTFVHSAYNSTSAIDLSVASPTITLDFQWSVHDDLCGSDHFPIFLTTHTEDNTTHPRYNFKKANWNLFGDLCSAEATTSQYFLRHMPRITPPILGTTLKKLIGTFSATYVQGL